MLIFIKILTILDHETTKLKWIILLFLVISTLDLIGLGIVGHYISIVIDSDISDNLVKKYANIFNLDVKSINILIYLE